MVTFVVDTYEATHTYPIVTHRFSGDTRREALRYYQAHLQTDAFLRACVQRGRFGTGANAFPCRTTSRWE